MENKKFRIYCTNPLSHPGFHNENLEVFRFTSWNPEIFPFYGMETGMFPVYVMKPRKFPGLRIKNLNLS